MTTSIERAFQDAFQEGDMEPVRAAFLRSKLFVVAKAVPPNTAPSYYAQPSPVPDEMCLTVAEKREYLDGIEDIDIIEWSGKEILLDMPKHMGVLILYSGGGNYLDVDNLNWFRASII